MLSDKAAEKAQSGLVITVGPGKQHRETDATLPVPVAVGEMALWGRYDGARLKYNNAEHTLLKDTDLALAWSGGELSMQANPRPLGDKVLIKVTQIAGQTASGAITPFE